MQVIEIHPHAPDKPAVGGVCNGCGVCCLSEPCPLGMVLSGRRHGACDALRWDSCTDIYRCGAMTDPQAVLHQALPIRFKRWSTGLAPWLRRIAGRWIASGKGCDCNLAVERVPQSDRQSAP